MKWLQDHDFVIATLKQPLLNENIVSVWTLYTVNILLWKIFWHTITQFYNCNGELLFCTIYDHSEFPKLIGKVSRKSFAMSNIDSSRYHYRQWACDIIYHGLRLYQFKCYILFVFLKSSYSYRKCFD